MGGRRLDIDVPNCAGIYRRCSALYLHVFPGLLPYAIEVEPRHGRTEK